MSDQMAEHPDVVDEIPVPDEVGDLESPKKNPVKRRLIIAAGVAVLAAVILIFALTLWGKSPEKTVKNWYAAKFEGDNVTVNKCLGMDYRQALILQYEDSLDDQLDFWYDYMFDVIDEVDIGVDIEHWEERLDKVDDIEGYADYLIDFFKMYSKLYNEELNCSYELKNLECEEITSAKKLKRAEKFLEEWYEDLEDDGVEDAVLFDPDGVKAFYAVEYEFKTKVDGERDSDAGTALVVKTAKGYFIISTDYAYTVSKDDKAEAEYTIGTDGPEPNYDEPAEGG